MDVLCAQWESEWIGSVLKVKEQGRFENHSKFKFFLIVIWTLLFCLLPLNIEKGKFFQGHFYYKKKLTKHLSRSITI